MDATYYLAYSVEKAKKKNVLVGLAVQQLCGQ